MEELAGNDLSVALFAAAQERELKVEGELEKTGRRAAAVSDIHLHQPALKTG